LKAAQKQQYIMMFPAPIAFLNDELKAEIGMKSMKEEEEEDAKFCSLKVPMDHEYKDSKTYAFKIKKYDKGTPEKILRWRFVFNEQIKNYGYIVNYNMVMNLAQAMLAGRGLEEFLNEQWAQDTKKQNTQGKGATRVHSTTYLYCAIFELAIFAFDIQSGNGDVLMDAHGPWLSIVPF
jgi:hypothetical protein